MQNRRGFFKSCAAVGALGVIGAPAAESLAQTQPAPAGARQDDRPYWVSVLDKLSGPVLGHLSRRQLKQAMPVESAPGVTDRSRYTYLEAFGRLLCGIAPWLKADGLEETESGLQKKYAGLARSSLDAATDPHSPDFMNFNRGGQPLVDAAFLAEAILRAPSVLWDPLEPRVRRQVIDAFKATRAIGNPTGSNWVMFSAMVETALLFMNEPTIEDRLEGSLRRMLGWYLGDGTYGDGRFFHWDYYNSFVIQPMLVDVLEVLRRQDNRYEPAYNAVLRRARRYAEIEERLIAPDGSFPSLGRSTAYRFGAFQVLAQVSLLRQLPPRVKPAQVRSALTAVIRRMIEAPGTFDANGWLRIGFCGHQPSLGERYISTGSLYLCSVALMPLGLPPADPFWNKPAARWTSQQLWSGEDLPADHALADRKTVEVPPLKRED